VDEVLINLQPHMTPDSRVTEIEPGTWLLEIPTGPGGRYRLAQLDDYSQLPRRDFPWKAPLRISLQARTYAETSPGTWGFGLWNDPFSMAILGGRGVFRFPALPNAAWFFFASAPNYLSLDDDLPHQGNLAATFQSPKWVSFMLPLGVLGLPFLAIPASARLLRRLGRKFIRQAAVDLPLDPTDWHSYLVEWKEDGVNFSVDGDFVMQTPISPLGPLGLVLWVDNQYVTLPPDGHFRYGTLANTEETRVEIRNMIVSRPSGSAG